MEVVMLLHPRGICISDDTVAIILIIGGLVLGVLTWIRWYTRPKEVYIPIHAQSCHCDECMDCVDPTDDESY